MSAAFRPTTVNDLPTLAGFLTRVYKFAPSDPHADIRLLEWKYLCPRPGWEGSRSYIVEKDGRIVAHCGVAPVTFCLPHGSVVRSLTMMDWAADPAIAGAGVLLLRKAMEMAPTSFIIGGAAMTREIVPRIGFRQVAECPTFAGWLRPWREFRTRPLTARSALRLAHGWAHPVRKHATIGSGWDVMAVGQFEDSLQSVLCRSTQWTSCRRTLADLNYLLKCPHLEIQGFLLHRENHPAGYFVVGKSAWETRVLDFAIDSDDAAAWISACGVLAQTIARDPNGCRIRIQATVPILMDALLRNGYWLQGREPLFLYDPYHLLDQALPVGFQLFDGDAGY